MSINRDIKELFKDWNDLNNQVGQSFQEFDFSTLREFRDKQREIEDSIYLILLNSAPPELKKILPDECGSMEIGFDTKKSIFYFLMEDPETIENEELQILAITIDSDKNIEVIKDFKNES